MRHLACSMAVSLCAASLVSAGPLRDEDFEAWRSLAVQSGGRQKPLDTLARVLDGELEHPKLPLVMGEEPT